MPARTGLANNRTALRATTKTVQGSTRLPTKHMRLR
jgi:hypothetical protein